MKNLFSLLVLIVCLAPIAFPLEAAVSNAAESIAPAVAETKEPGIDDRINEAMKPVAKKIAAIVFYKLEIGNVAVPLTVTWLVLGAVFFTFFFGFINLRGFTHAISLIKGDYDDPNDPGEVNHFQALKSCPDFSITSQSGALRKLPFLGGAKMKETQRDPAGAI